jgi:hypothetical protein
MRTIDWPFRADEALETGALTFRELRRFHEGIYPGVWAPRGVNVTAVHRVGVDFEGAHHRTDPKQRTKDVVRYAVLPELGWIDVRLTSGILHTNPQPFLDRVGAALIARGCPKTW